MELGTNEFRTGNGNHRRAILNITLGCAVERVKQNHLHFHKECMYLELTHTILLGRDASEESVTSWGKQQIWKEFPSDSIWQTIRTSHYRMNDAIIWCVSRSVSGHIQGALVPNSDHGYRRIWLESAISYIAFVSPECEHVKSLSQSCLTLAAPWTVAYQAP